MKYGDAPINGSPIRASAVSAAVTASPSLVTIPNVEIVSTGTYQLGSGEHTFTEEELVAAVDALDDPAVRPPRLKLGHESDWGDAEPCFGKVLNMRLNASKNTIIGDYVGVPKWLAEVMASAFPSRSIEGATNAETSTGKVHDMIIEAVSLLGVILPGVSTLEDLAASYGDDMPEGTQIVAGTPIAASVIPQGSEVRASVSTEDVRRAYYEGLGDDHWSWWIKDVRLEPDELIVQDDDSGELYRVPFTVSGSDTTFADPVNVETVYVDKSDAAVAASKHGRSIALYASRDESRKDTEQENPMDPKLIRASLGLSEDATDEEVIAAAAALKASEDERNDQANDRTDDGDGEGENDGPDVESDEAAEGEKEVVPETNDDGTVKVDAKVFADLRAAAGEGRAARKEQLIERRETTLAAAVQAGKIAPASKDSWRKKLVANREATEAELESLEPGLLPVEETKVEAGSDASNDAYDKSLFPELAASAGDKPDVITREV